MVDGIRPQAHVQRQILAVLARSSAPSVVALATQVGASRPSVSRALRRLAEMGLVLRTESGWAVTVHGRAATVQPNHLLAPSVVRALQRQARLEDALGRDAGSAARVLLDSPRFPIDLTGIVAAVKAMEAGPGALAALRTDASAGMIAFAALADARSSALDGIRLQLEALTAGRPAWATLLAENLSVSGRIAADVSAMSTALEDPSRRATSATGALEMAVAQVVMAHHEQLAAAVERLAVFPARVEPLGGILWPTTTTASFTGAARTFAVPTRPTRGLLDAVGDLTADVAELLERVGAPAAARDIRAAFEQLHMRASGWEKAEPHLVREALREVLDELAPPDKVPADAGGIVTKRAQVIWICGGDKTLGIFADVVASNVGKLHSLLSAEAKNRGASRLGWHGQIGLLETAVGILRTIADQASRNGR